MKNKKKSSLKRWSIVTLFFLCVSNFMLAQGIKVKGVVTDTTNEPLIGAAVTVKGTSTGTITDLDGNFIIDVSSNDDVLVISYIGFTPQEVKVAGKTVINVVLGEDVKALDEVVVVGYGVQKESHLTGSVTKVETDGLSDLPAPRIDQALQGKIAGVQITNTTSEAGVAPQIREGMGDLAENDKFHFYTEYSSSTLIFGNPGGGANKFKNFVCDGEKLEAKNAKNVVKFYPVENADYASKVVSANHEDLVAIFSLPADDIVDALKGENSSTADFKYPSWNLLIRM